MINAPHNPLRKIDTVMPLFGRLVLVSADAGDMEGIIVGANGKSFIRKMFSGYASQCLSEDREQYGLSAMTCSVASTTQRRDSTKYMIDGLLSIPLNIFKVPYVASLRGVLFGRNAELSTTVLEKILGVESLNSLGDIREAVTNILSGTVVAGVAQSLNSLMQRVDEFTSSSCPVCLETLTVESRAVLLSPCWHYCCQECMNSMQRIGILNCPICRSNVEGVQVTTGDDKTSTKIEAVEEIPVNNLAEHIQDIVRQKRSLLRTVEGIVKGIHKYREYSERILLIAPNDEFAGRLSSSIADITLEKKEIVLETFSLTGNVRKRVTAKSLEKQISRFKNTADETTRVICTCMGNTDTMTGLDIHETTTIISIEKSNVSQQVGRVAGIPRILLRSSRSVKYFEVFPHYSGEV